MKTLTFILLCLSLSSCTKDKLPNICLLNEVYVTNSYLDNRLSHEYFYDSKNRLIQTRYTSKIKYDDNNRIIYIEKANPQVGPNLNYSYSYENDSTLWIEILRWVFDTWTGPSESKTKYKYILNAKEQVTRIYNCKNYSNVQDTLCYLELAIDYYPNDNIKSISRYSNYNVISWTQYYEYDQNKNPFFHINIFPKFELYYLTTLEVLPSRNNVIRIETFDFRDDTIVIQNLRYDYNEFDYPIRKIYLGENNEPTSTFLDFFYKECPD